MTTATAPTERILHVDIDPFSAAAKQALEDALRQALALRHRPARAAAAAADGTCRALLVTGAGVAFSAGST